jgi:hypothetical protein
MIKEMIKIPKLLLPVVAGVVTSAVIRKFFPEKNKFIIEENQIVPRGGKLSLIRQILKNRAVKGGIIAIIFTAICQDHIAEAVTNRTIIQAAKDVASTIIQAAKDVASTII